MARDYLLRLFEKVSEMLAGILLEKRGGNDLGAQTEIEKACLAQTGLPWAFVERSSPEALDECLRKGANYHYRAILLAELLLQDADLKEAESNAVAVVRDKLMAFYLIKKAYVVLSPEEKAVYQEKLDSLSRELRATSNDVYLENLMRG